MGNGGSQRASAQRGPVQRARRVDAVDKGIIEALQVNGREPFRRIAATLGREWIGVERDPHMAAVAARRLRLQRFTDIVDREHVRMR